MWQARGNGPAGPGSAAGSTACSRREIVFCRQPQEQCILSGDNGAVVVLRSAVRPGRRYSGTVNKSVIRWYVAMGARRGTPAVQISPGVVFGRRCI